MFKRILIVIFIVIFLGLAVLLIQSSKSELNPVVGKIQIVAAENFWGSLVSQIGGNQVDVVSLVSDPNADPHEYEVNASVARLFAKANYVIINGAGYDSWAQSMISSSGTGSLVLNVAQFLGKKNGDNPHFWYNPDYVNQIIEQMKNNLIKLKPNQRSYFSSNYQKLQNKLKVYQDNLALIKKQFQGVKVASTEDIFYYMASASGLDLISPPEFMQAVANGNDPSASSIVTFQNQLKNHQVKLLIFNSQTINPITDSMKQLASENNIPTVAITETIQPPNQPFQDWMNQEIIDIKSNL